MFNFHSVTLKSGRPGFEFFHPATSLLGLRQFTPLRSVFSAVKWALCALSVGAQGRKQTSFQLFQG